MHCEKSTVCVSWPNSPLHNRINCFTEPFIRFGLVCAIMAQWRGLIAHSALLSLVSSTSFVQFNLPFIITHSARGKWAVISLFIITPFIVPKATERGPLTGWHWFAVHSQHSGLMITHSSGQLHHCVSCHGESSSSFSLSLWLAMHAMHVLIDF